MNVTLINQRVRVCRMQFEHATNCDLALELSLTFAYGEHCICYVFPTAAVPVDSVVRRLPLLAIFTEAIVAKNVSHTDLALIRTHVEHVNEQPSSYDLNELLRMSQTVHDGTERDAAIKVNWEFDVILILFESLNMHAVIFVLTKHERTLPIVEANGPATVCDLPTGTDCELLLNELRGALGISDSVIHETMYPAGNSPAARYCAELEWDWRGPGYQPTSDTSLQFIVLGIRLRRAVATFLHGHVHLPSFDNMLSDILRLREEMCLLHAGLETVNNERHNVPHILAHLDGMQTATVSDPAERLTCLLANSPNADLVLNWLRVSIDQNQAARTPEEARQPNSIIERALSRIVIKGESNEYESREPASPEPV